MARCTIGERPERGNALTVLRHIDTGDTDMPPRKRNMNHAEFRQHLIDNSEPVTVSGCWIWMGTTDADGYGVLKSKGKMLKAHRLSYELFNGPIPDDKCVCHSCDVRSCIAPAHLWLGGNADNMRDMNLKGRQPKGEAHGMARLTEASVINIRSRAASGESQRALACEYGAGATTIGKIVKRLTWKHI